jgi:uncharacterized membrane protein
MRRLYLSARAKLALALGISSLASMGLYVAGLWGNHDGAFGYLSWNLLLAWIALLAALWLERVLSTSLWSSWYALLVTAVWLVFLPNTFYMVSDFIHIQEAGQVDLLYDVVLFSSFIFNGVLLGFLSLAIVHWQLVKRVSSKFAALLVGLVLLLCSFAIYIGRELRWNTWDIVANPSSILFDVSDRVLNPREHPQTFTTTISFFVLLGSTYLVLWYVSRLGRQQRDS